MGNRYLDNKKILIVDDEPDILETLEELLPMCSVQKADNYDEAVRFLENESFDIAILDIMGVDGYKLLEKSKAKGIITVMLTAHAFSTQDTLKSFKEGAASYIPKEAIVNITTYLNDILEAKEAGQHSWWRWLDRFSSYYAKKFTPEWQEKDREFWEKFPFYI